MGDAQFIAGLAIDLRESRILLMETLDIVGDIVSEAGTRTPALERASRLRPQIESFLSRPRGSL